MRNYITAVVLVLVLLLPHAGLAWNDETHLAVAKAAGYAKWYNAAGADMVKIKAGEIEGANHYYNSVPNETVSQALISDQIRRYNTKDKDGHLYGAIVQAVRDYIETRKKGKYGEYHLAFCAHYIGDLTMPLHNIRVSEFTRKMHKKMEAFVNEGGIDPLVSAIRPYPIEITSESDLMQEISRIASISIALGYTLEKENRGITKEEAGRQLTHGASLFKGVLSYVQPTKKTVAASVILVGR